MRQPLRTLALHAAAGLVALAGVAASPSADAAARDRLEAFTRGLQGLEGRFEQRVIGPDGSITEESAGTVALRAPRQFRWEYETPFPQLILADGDQLWIYDPDLEQVTVRAQSAEEQSSPLAVLVDPGELERQFTVSEDGYAEGSEWLRLVPREPDGAGFVLARLGFDANGLARMQLEDSLGQKTEVRFTPWTRNPGFATGHFSFEVPEGVDVVGELIEHAEVTPLGE
jgi:outer membrane lipoprotein carrier protein